MEGNVMKKIMICLFALCMLTGCSTRIMDLTVASTNNIDLNKNQYRIGEKVEDIDKKSIIVFIPTGIPSIEEAISKAIEIDKCAVGLSDLAVYRESWWIPYIYGKMGYRVKGKLIYDTSLKDCKNILGSRLV